MLRIELDGVHTDGEDIVIVSGGRETGRVVQTDRGFVAVIGGVHTGASGRYLGDVLAEVVQRAGLFQSATMAA